MALRAKLSVYNCLSIRVIDGDSFVVLGDVRPVVPDTTVEGWQPKVRILGVDAPERGEEGWSEARALLEEWLGRGGFNLICYGRDKYGRLLADAERGSGLLSSYLVSEGISPMAASKAAALVVDGEP